MRGKRLHKSILVLVAFIALVMTCTTTAEAATKLSKKKATLYVGETLQLKLAGGSGKGTWKSSKSKVASVNKKGLVTAKKKGNCKITVKESGKTYTCNITVKQLPKNYATVNGKRVKVGKTVTLKYKIQSNKPIAVLSVRYVYDKTALKITNEEEMSRYPTWICNEYYPDSIIDGKVYDICHLVNCDTTRTDGLYYKNLSCKSPKVYEKMKVKVLKSGNYKMKADVYDVMDEESNTIKDYKITTTIK